mmetsp:Transcript_88703/g.231542  ORF Transcript_88703/g.231542 Transcript_88703/m.231542 type:complete len:767 (+) Transcript_88703:772-3072(+)
MSAVPQLQSARLVLVGQGNDLGQARRPSEALRRDGQREQGVDLRDAPDRCPELRLVAVELLEDLRQKGEDAILALVFQRIHLRDKLRDEWGLKPQFGFVPESLLDGLQICLRQRGQVALDFEPVAGQAVHERELHLRKLRPHAHQLLLQVGLVALDLQAQIVVRLVRSLRRPELHLPVRRAGVLHHTAEQSRDDPLQVGQATAPLLHSRDLRKPLWQVALTLQRGRSEQSQAVLVAEQQLAEHSQPLGRHILVVHGVPLALQGEAPDSRRGALQIHQDLLEARAELRRHIGVPHEELNGLLPLADVLGLIKRRAEPLLEQPEAEFRACVVQVLQQRPLVGAFQGFQNFQGRESCRIQHQSPANAAGSCDSVLQRIEGGCQYIPDGNRQHTLRQQGHLQVLDDPCGGNRGTVLCQDRLQGLRELVRVCEAVFAEGAPRSHRIASTELQQRRQLWSARQTLDHAEHIGWDVGHRVHHLCRLTLREQGAQGVAVQSVLEGAHLNLRSGTIYQARGELEAVGIRTCSRSLVEVQAQHVLGARAAEQLGVHQRAVRVDFASVALDASGPSIFLVGFPLLLLHHPLDLLDDDNLVASIDDLSGICVLGHLREADMRLLLPHPLEVADALGDEGVVVEELIELTHLEEGDLVEVVCLELPVLQQHRCPVRRRLLLRLPVRHPKSALVVGGVGGRAAVRVLQVLRHQPRRPRVLRPAAREVAEALSGEGRDGPGPRPLRRLQCRPEVRFPLVYLPRRGVKGRSVARWSATGRGA